MKKTALFLTFTALLIVLALLPFWDFIYGKFANKGREGNFAQLNFKSIDGEYDVFIDGEKVGTVASQKQGDFTKISPGVKNIKVVRKSSIENYFYVLERNLDFVPSSQVEIEWEAGPSLESSSGIVKYFTQVTKPNGAEIYILPLPKNSTVEFDSRRSENNMFEIFDTATHNVKVSNGEDFDSRSISINLTDQNEKKVLTNLKLIVEVYLYRKPFK